MKIYLLIIILALLSCSNNEKFSSEKAYIISIDGISYKVNSSNELFVDEHLSIESKNYYSEISLSKLYDEYYIINYFWIVNGDTIRYDDKVNAIYGLNSVKLVLMDYFGDTISDSIYFKVKEPLKVNLLSPIDGFSDFSTTDNVIFQYELSGEDSWEQVQSFVYVSSIKPTYEEPLWKEENELKSNILTPPIDEQIYYWGVKAFTEQDTVFSGIRWIELKN